MPAPSALHPPAAQLQALGARVAAAPLAVAQSAVQLAGRFPRSWQPWALLARALSRAGKGPEAATAWSQAQSRATDRNARLTLAQDALQHGNPELCDTLLTAVCNGEPDNVRLWLQLSRLRRDRGLAAAALPVARSLARRHPGPVEVWLELAEVEAARADTRACRAAVREALTRLPVDHHASAPHRLTAGRLLLAAGFAAEAEELVAELPSTLPGRDTALGLIHERRGRPAEAVALLEPSIAAGQAGPYELSSWARALRKTPRAAEARAALEQALPQVPFPPARRLLLHRLGELCEALDDPEAAFHAHAAASATGRLPWSPEGFERELAAVHALAQRPLPPPPTPAPGAGIVLIAGMPRSGTSLLEQILTTHPAVQGIGESPALLRALEALPGPKDRSWPDRLADASPTARAAAGARYRGAVEAEAGTTGIRLDKTPPNLLLVDGLARILPGARAILLRRDLRDTCVSCFFQGFGPYYAWTDHLPWLGRVARGYDALRQRWLDRPPLPVLGLDYEDLVAHPEDSLRRVLAFLDLPWHPALLAFHESDREVRTASYDQVRSPIHTRSVGRAEAYAPWLGPLDAALAEPTG